MSLTYLFRLTILLVLSGLLVACSTNSEFFSSDDKSYRSQRQTVDSLEIPPDLSSSAIEDALQIPGGSSASYSDYRTRQGGSGTAGGSSLAGSQILPEFPGIEYMREGDLRWLEIDASPEQVWPKVVEFWRKNGLLLVQQDPATGVMTTDWLESRADIKQGMITEFFRKTFDSIHSSATRDQFRVRIERGDKPDTTELFLTHRGMEEKLVQNVSGEADTTYWTPRPNEPETEAAMLRSLMIYLGTSEEKANRTLAAKTQPKPERTQLIKTKDSVELVIDEGFARAWRLTGVALDRVGFSVEDRDRSQGIYYVRYHALEDKEEKGFFAKMAFWRDDDEIDDQSQYQVKLESDGSETRAVVNDAKGVRQNNPAAIRLLTLLHEQIH
ncbi:MAG: outer membrane protein assembly factor BamC [Chromatiales bacterium]|jgi:outer membrane protein assembly factor BamC